MSTIAKKEIEKQYLNKRQRAIDIAETRKQEIYKEIPVLKVVDAQVSEKSIDLARQIILSSPETKQEVTSKLKKEINELKFQKQEFIEKNGYAVGEIYPSFECKLCNDLGYIVNQEGISTMCPCFEQRLLNEMYKQESLKMEDENFSLFDIGFYSSKPNKSKYGTDMSPKDNILYIKSIAEKFIESFDNNAEKNLLFIGNVGTGKTFLVNCISKELLKVNKTIVYQTAPILMDMIMEYKFKQKSDDSYKEQYNKIFDADLLVIDDLGTETLNESRCTELFNIINTRLLKNKKMIISTNLDLKDMYQTYEERIVSRIIGNFTICKFIGEDIRIIKKQII